MLVAIGCAASARPAVLHNTDRAPSRAAIEVRFDETTIAFYMHGMPRPDFVPMHLDDRDCPEVDTAWPDAEDAVLRAFDAARRTDRHRPFDSWRSIETVRTEHAASARWLDADGAISQRRRRRDPAMDLAARIGARGGYLVVWGKPSVVFCFDVKRAAAGDAIELVPRISRWVDS